MLTKFSVKRPYVIAVMVLIIVVLGVVSVLNTDVDFLPNMDLPYVVVATVYAGQPAEIVESDVTAVLEQALGNMSAVQSVTSMSYDNVSVISLQLSSGSDVDAVADEIQGRLSSAGLPDSPYLQESMVIKANPNMLPSMSISVSRKGESVPDNMEYFNALADRIRAVDGVQDVTVQGLINNYIMVSLNDEKTADVLHTQVKEGITGDSALSKFYSSLAEHLSGALNELEQYTLSDLSELSIYLQNLAAFYDELNDFLATDSGIAAMTDPSDVIKATTSKIDELLALGTYSAANTIIKSIYPETADYAAVHINRLMLSSSATGDTYGKQVANAAAAANSAVALIADAMVNISPDVFEDIFDYIANDSAPMAAQTPEAIKTLTETRLASFGTDLAEGHPYRNAAEYVRAHTAEFAQAVVDYCANLSSLTPATADSVREGAATALANADKSALEEQLCAALGYNSLDELFTALTGDDTAEIYKKLTQTLSGVIDSDLIGTLIQAQNISLPAGSYTENGITYIVNVDGSISTLQDLIFMPATGINLLSLVTSSWGDAEGILSFLLSLLPPNDNESALEKPIVQEFLLALINGDVSSFNNGGKWDELGEALNIEDTTLLQQWAVNVYIDKGGEFVALLEDAGFISPDTSDNEGNYLFNADAAEEFAKEAREFTISLSLSDIADITVIDTSAMVYSKLDGVNSITLSITKQAGYSGATLSDDLNKLLSDLTQEDGFADLQYSVLYDDGEYTNQLISTVIQNLLWGALLAVVVLFIFLKDLRPTLLTTLSMVISVVATFVIMYFAGITLNLMSMAGLAMGIGMLVDNSVVVIENIYRLRSRGAPVKEAVITGTTQMSGAILASTITSLIVWLPIVFTQGLTKTVVKDMAVTLCLALAVSLVVAITLVPSLAQYTVKNYRPKPEKVMGKVKKAYARGLSFTLKHKWISLVVVVVMLGLAVTSFFFMDSRFFPETDTGSLTVTISLDAGAINEGKDGRGETLDYDDVRDSVTGQVTEYLMAMDETEHVNMTISSNVNIAGYNIQSEGMNIGADTITATVKLTDGKRDSAKKLCDRLVDELSDSANIDYAQYIKVECSTGTVIDTAVASDNLTVNVYGDDLDELKAAAGQLSSSIAQLDGVSYTSDNVSGSGISYTLEIDREKAMELGLTAGEIYLQISEYLTDVTLSPAATLTVSEGGNEGTYDVLVYDYYYSLLTWHKGFASSAPDVPVEIYYKDSYLKEGTSYSVLRKYYLIGEDGAVTSLTPDKDGSGANVTDENGFLSLNGGAYKADTSEEYFSDDSARADILDMDITYTLNGHIGGTQTGSVKLSELLTPASFNDDGSLKTEEGMVSIDRRDGRRYSAVTVCLQSGASSSAVADDIQALIAAYNSSHPDSAIEIEFVAQTAEVEEIYTTLYIVLGIAIVLVYLVMAAQFGSLKTPFIIMFTIPLAFTGSLLALFITGVGISVVAVLGLIMLMGVVVNNGIIFVELADKLVKEGVEKRTALITAGATRLRPILITTLTTIVGLIITACDSSATGRMLQPMAITSIGGLLYATVVTLFFIPVIYDLFKRKKKGAPSPEPAPADFDPDKLLAEIEGKSDNVTIEELPAPEEGKFAKLFRRMRKKAPGNAESAESAEFAESAETDENADSMETDESAADGEHTENAETDGAESVQISEMPDGTDGEVHGGGAPESAENNEGAELAVTAETDGEAGVSADGENSAKKKKRGRKR